MYIAFDREIKIVLKYIIFHVYLAVVRVKVSFKTEIYKNTDFFFLKKCQLGVC